MSTTYEITGTIHRISDTVVVKDTFRKREFIVMIPDGQYPQHVKLQCTQDRCSLLDGLKPGDPITVAFNVRGRLYTDKNGQETAFTNLEAWRIDRGNAEPPTKTAEQVAASFDDVPF